MKQSKTVGAVLLGLACALCLPVAKADRLEDMVAPHQKRLAGRIGLAVLDTASGRVETVNGELRFPMLGTLRVLACGKLLSEADAGRMSLAQPARAQQDDLSAAPPDAGANRNLSVRQACEFSLTRGDSAATNLVIGSLGGPHTVTSFMHGLGDRVTRLDRMDPDYNNAMGGDPRDTSSPMAMAQALQTLLLGNALSPASRTLLQQWMTESVSATSAFRTVLPEGWRMAELSGLGGNGSGATAAVLWPKGRAPLIITLYLTQTRADPVELNRSMALIGREVFALYR